ncbi:MAG: HD domain-containing phosphohydrolase [Burkholderiaceae bacterium]
MAKEKNLELEALKKRIQELEQQLAEKLFETKKLQDVSIMAMAIMAEIRDYGTSKHILRVQHYVQALAQRLKTHPRFSQELTDEAISVIFISTPLHDIGMVGIPERIMLKPGDLTSEERNLVRSHPVMGHEILTQAEQLLGEHVEFYKVAKQITLSHQEKWDGSGYPQGLAGEAIPLAARLMAVADVYDASISPRVYRAGLSHQEALEKVVAAKGTQLDPDLVDAFVAIERAIQAIASRYVDTDEDIQKKIKYMAFAIAEKA